MNQILSPVAPTVRARPIATKTRLRSVGSIPEHMLPEAAIPDQPTQQLLSALRGKYGSGGKHVPRRVMGIIETLATAARQDVTSKEKFVPSLLPIDNGEPEDVATLPELLAAIDRLPMSAGGASRANVGDIADPDPVGQSLLEPPVEHIG